MPAQAAPQVRPYPPAPTWRAARGLIEDARSSSWAPDEAAEAALRNRPGDGPPTEFAWRIASGSTYAEQVGLDVIAGLVAACPEAEAKLVLATAVTDEARHSAAFRRYAELAGGSVNGPTPAADELLAVLLGLDDFSARFIAHTLAEGIAADQFHWFTRALVADGLAGLYKLVRRDENRHVALGMGYLVAGPGTERLRQIPAELVLAAEEAIFSTADLVGMGAMIGRLLPGVAPERVTAWVRGRHERRMRLLISVRHDRDELAERRLHHAGIPSVV